ncbi:chain length determinant protein tyrosine kinase EpsG [Uliginosibacterium flavum]
MNAPSHTTDHSRSIGAILIDAGRLTPENAERVLRVCREHGARFGDTAIQLGAITQADVDFALARQFDYATLPLGDQTVSEEVIAAFATNAQTVEGLRALRTQLMLRWFDSEAEHKAIAITSPEHGEGRSWLAANLAVVFSQLGERTLLIDADMRRPRQHELFKLDNRVGLSAILSGRAGSEAIKRITPLLGLSVLPSGATPPNPQELLARPAFSQLLEKLSETYDVILIDTPPATDYADAQTVAVRASGALLVARKNVSSSNQLRDAATIITQAGAVLVGSVINEI